MNPRVTLVAFTWICGMGCAQVLRLGGQYRTLDAHPVVEGQFTAGLGFYDGEPRHGAGYVLLPTVSVMTGAQIDGGQGEGAIELGGDVALFKRMTGVHLSPRVGAGMYGTTGAYLGLRGGPELRLIGKRHPAWAPVISLEGLAGVGLGGELGAGSGVFGLTLSVGIDAYEPYRPSRLF